MPKAVKEQENPKVAETLFHPDDVYQMNDIPEMGTLGPAAIVKHLAAYLSDDENRQPLQYININSVSAEATDGHRFIRIPRERIVTPIPDGAYRPVKDGKNWLLIAVEHQLTFPNLDMAIPKDLPKAFERDIDPKGHTDIAVLLYYLAKKDTCISHVYAEDIPNGTYTVCIGKPEQPVLFLGDYTVGIMPIKL